VPFVQLADNLGIIINNHAITWGYPIKSASSLPRGNGLRQLVLHNLSAEDPPKSVQTNSEMCGFSGYGILPIQGIVFFFSTHPNPPARVRNERSLHCVKGASGWVIVIEFCGDSVELYD
jgi:hypothetical protein